MYIIYSCPIRGHIVDQIFADDREVIANDENDMEFMLRKLETQFEKYRDYK